MGNYTDEQAGNMRGLVKLMRRNLELTEQLCVTMAEELDFVNTFINLEREALGDSCNLQIFLCLFLEKLNMPQNTPVTKAS